MTGPGVLLGVDHDIDRLVEIGRQDDALVGHASIQPSLYEVGHLDQQELHVALRRDGGGREGSEIHRGNVVQRESRLGPGSQDLMQIEFSGDGTGGPRWRMFVILSGEVALCGASLHVGTGGSHPETQHRPADVRSGRKRREIETNEAGAEAGRAANTRVADLDGFRAAEVHPGERAGTDERVVGDIGRVGERLTRKSQQNAEPKPKYAEPEPNATFPAPLGLHDDTSWSG
jgi:hypothetical protein